MKQILVIGNATELTLGCEGDFLEYIHGQIREVFLRPQ